MVIGAAAKQTTSNLEEELLLTRWYRLATDGSSDEDDQFVPILVDQDSPLSLHGKPYFLFPDVLSAAYDLSCTIWKDGIFLPKT